MTESEPEICAEIDEPPSGYKVIAMNSLSALFDILTSTCCKAKLLLGESTTQRWGIGNDTMLYVECSVCKIKTFLPTSNIEDERLKNIMKKGQTQDCFDCFEMDQKRANEMQDSDPCCRLACTRIPLVG